MDCPPKAYMQKASFKLESPIRRFWNVGPTLEKYVAEGVTLINLFCPLSTSTLHLPGIVVILEREVFPKKMFLPQCYVNTEKLVIPSSP